ncbi:MAG: DUF4350 domain-containing protein [Eikenella sp.]|nr:DUF4350 domain-containing protein [Eikenella sp.]
MSRAKKIGWGLLLALLAGAALVAANLVSESRRDWQEMDRQVAVKDGSFYGLKRLLQGYDSKLEVESARVLTGWSKAYGENQLMVVAQHDLGTRQDAQDLLAWVARGNHVVLSLHSYETDTEDADHFARVLTDSLRVKAEAGQELQKEDSDKQRVAIEPACRADMQRRIEAARAVAREPMDGQTQRHEIRSCSFRLNRIRLPEGGTLHVLPSDNDWDRTRYVPQQNSSVWFQGQSQNGSQLVALRHGNGSVVLSSRLDWLENPQVPMWDEASLNLYDHAYLAAYLAADREKVWLVQRLRSAEPPLHQPMWWKLLAAQPAAVLLLLLTGGVLLWRIAARVGVVRILPPAPERYLNQHLLAQGRFLNRHLSREAILKDLQRELLTQLHRRHPGWQNMPLHGQVALVCRQTQLPPKVVEPWLKKLPDNIGRAEWLAMLDSHQRMTRHMQRSWY